MGSATYPISNVSVGGRSFRRADGQITVSSNRAGLQSWEAWVYRDRSIAPSAGAQPVVIVTPVGTLKGDGIVDGTVAESSGQQAAAVRIRSTGDFTFE